MILFHAVVDSPQTSVNLFEMQKLSFEDKLLFICIPK